MLLIKDQSALVLVDVQEKLTPFVLEAKDLEARCAWMLNLAERLRVPTIVSEQYPQGLGATLTSLKKEGTRHALIEKVHFSCMQQPDFVECLRKLDKQQVILIGIEAHVCVLETALELKSAGYEVFVVVDAVSSRNKVDLKYGLKRMDRAGVHLVTAEMVFFEWLKHSKHPEFKALSKEFLQ